MTFADAGLVTALVKPSDHLKARATAFAARHVLTVPFSVGIELLFVARKHKASCRAFLVAASEHADVEGLDILLTAASALDKGQIATVFDAVHGAAALLEGTKLATTDESIRMAGFPVAEF